MASQQRVNITSPVGRIVMGSLYKGSTTDAEGKPLVWKSGPNVGQPRSNFFFALAVPKGAETHWAQTAWGQQIWAIGHTAFPQAAQSPAFSWKIEDGDSTVPNKKGNKPCDREGWPGHWIIKLSGNFAPKVYRPDNGSFVQALEENYVKPGYYVEVAFSVDGNGSQSQPGVYLNHSMVCFRGFGPEIVFGPDVNEAGFGQAPLPAGATMTPPAGAPLPVPAAAPLPAAPAAPGLLPVPVVPNPQFLQVPGVPPNPIPAPVAAVPAIPSLPATASPSNLPAPPAPPSGPKMTAKAAGVTYQAFITGGWSDAQLLEQGYMTL